jgi:hypothetical protein
MNKESHIVVLKAPFFSAVGVLQEEPTTSDGIEVIRRHDGHGYTVANLEREIATRKVVKIHRLETELTLEEAKKLEAQWLKEWKSKAASKQKQPAPNISEPPADPPPEIFDPTDKKLIIGDGDRRDIDKVRYSLMRMKWPRTLDAMAAKSDRESIAKAYLLDVAEFSGFNVFPDITPEMASQVAKALYNHRRRRKKTQSLILDEAIAFHWPKLLYLDNKQFADAVTKLTGIQVTAAQAKQRRVRLGLTSRCPPGQRRR